MKLLTPFRWLATKAQSSRDRYVDTSITVRDGFGYMGSKPRPFNYDAAVVRFRSWVYSAAMLNAQAVASVPLRLYVRKRTGRKLWNTRSVPMRRKRYLLGDHDHRPGRHVVSKMTSFGDDFEEIVDEHPVLDALRGVNPLMGAMDLTVLRVLHGELTGNAYLHPIHGNDGVPVELWPMFPQWTWVIPDRDGVDFIKGFLYGQSMESRMEFAPEEVIHFKRPNPKDLFYGMGKVEAAWSVLGLHEAEREHQTALYDNYARPDYLMIMKSGASHEELDVFEQKVNEQLRGTRKGGKFLGVTGDVDIKPLNFNRKELGDVDEVVEEIASVFGVPVTKLKANDPNRANAEEGDAGWMKDTINPLCIQDADVLNSKFLPLFGIQDDAVLAYDDPVPQNRQFELDANTRAIVNGWRLVNEVREEEGYEPLDGGDVLRFNGTPLEAMGAQNQPSTPFGFPLPPSAEVPRPALPSTPVEQPSAPAGAAATSPPTTPLAGPQIQAASDLLERLRAGTLPRVAAIELLVAVGIGRTSSEAMVDSMESLPQALTVEPEKSPSKSTDAAVSCTHGAETDTRAGGEDTRVGRKTGDDLRNERLADGDAAGDHGVSGGMPADDDAGENRAGAERRDTEGEGRTGLVDGDRRGVRGLEAASGRPEPLTETGHDRSASRDGVHKHGDNDADSRVEKQPLDDGAQHGGASLSSEGRQATDQTDSGRPSANRQAVAGDGRVDASATQTTRTVKQSDLWLKNTTCCVKAETGDADDTERDGESERVIQDFTADVLAVLKEYEQSVVSAMETTRSKKPRVKLTERSARTILERLREEYGDKVAEAARPYVERVFAMGGSVGYAEIRFDGVFDVTNPRVAEFIRQHTIELAGQVAQSTTEALSEVIGAGLDEGLTGRDIAKRIRALDETTFGKQRAEMIARTESARAYTDGREQSWVESGVVEGKKFQLAAQACPICEAVAKDFGEKTTPLGEPFYKKGDTITGTDGTRVVLDYSDVNGPPVHPRCRCSVLAVLRQ